MASAQNDESLTPDYKASIEFLRGRGQKVELASYDDRQLAAARGLGISIAAL